MKDKTDEGNFIHIPLDIGERRRLRGKLLDAAHVPENLTAGRFETIPSNSIGTSHSIAPDTAPAVESSTSRVTAANYQKVYLEQRAKEATAQAAREKEMAAQKSKGLDPAAKAQQEAKAAQERKAADEARFRARELQDQIVWWERQRGQGSYNDSIVESTIDDLRRQLGAIPSAYW